MDCLEDHPFYQKGGLNRRPRRNRKSSSIRAMIQETHLHPAQLVAPLFVMEGVGEPEPIAMMPGIYRFPVVHLIDEVVQLKQIGIQAIDLFCVVPTSKKDAYGSEALKPGNLLQIAVRAIKEAVPDICVMVDIALDPFTDHGHDGLLNEKGDVDNDSTLFILSKMALLAAEAGADVIAPSDMMDGRIGFLRSSLDKSGYGHVSILAYAAKYASSFYGPFRSALGSALKRGDKKSYQLNPANSREALLECRLDEEEGADFLLVKPALAYLDILSALRAMTTLPIGAYHVSGEYSMVMAAAEKGWLDADQVFFESLLSIRRAGADFILTYAAKRIAQFLRRP